VELPFPLSNEYGYTESGTGYPFFGVTVADQSLAYSQAAVVSAFTTMTVYYAV
jgi:hypothetical protein